MPTRFQIISPPLDWSRRKLDLMKRDIIQMLAMAGAPNCEWIENAEVPGVAPVGTHLHLTCGKCSEEWWVPYFTACPRGCGKESVNKKSPGRVIPPAPVAHVAGAAPPHEGPPPSQEQAPAAPAPTPAGKRVPTFSCKDCSESWQAPAISPCPRCNSKLVIKARAKRGKAA